MANSPQRGLGKGLAALLDDAAAASIVHNNSADQNTPSSNQKSHQSAQTNSNTPQNSSNSSISAAETTLSVQDLQPSSVQPRREFNANDIATLSASIKAQGVLQPLLVRKVNNTYEIIGGERRWRAAQQAGLTEVPVIIRELDDGRALEVALVENIQRADLNPIEEALGYKRLTEEFKYTHEDISQVTGKSRSHITNLLRLLSLPQTLKTCVSKGSLTMGHARALLGLSQDSQLQIRAANKVIKHKLSVRETEDLVRNLINPNQAARGRRTKDAQTTEIEKNLQKSLGLKVAMRRQTDTGAGSIRIFFDDMAQLDHLLNNFKQTQTAE